MSAGAAAPVHEPVAATDGTGAAPAVACVSRLAKTADLPTAVAAAGYGRGSGAVVAKQAPPVARQAPPVGRQDAPEEPTP